MNIIGYSFFEKMFGTGTQIGDYLLLDLTLPEEKQTHIGVVEQRHGQDLKKYTKFCIIIC